jgi:hypothetical protein
MREEDREIVPLELPKDLIREYRRIADIEGLTGSEIVGWCLGYGLRAYAAGERPNSSHSDLSNRPLNKT